MKFPNLMRAAIFTFMVLILQVTANFGQDALTNAYQQLEPGGELPEELLSTRSAVFIKVPGHVSQDHPHHWRQLGIRLQEKLAELHIDAVAYYLWQDLTAGRDATAAFMGGLSGREIAQVILLEKVNNTFRLSVIQTDDSPAFINTQQPVWQMDGSDLDVLLDNFTSVISRRGLERTNFLVIENPEFFTDTRIFQQNRFESFQPDLKLDKLAVPVEGSDDPDSLRNPLSIKLRNQLAEYPFNYEFVDYSKGEDVLINGGFQYLLLYLQGPESSVRRLLNYPAKEGGQDREVFKFYTRHIRSGDIYLGDQWDAAPEFEIALRKHITNLKSALNVE